MTKRNPKRNPRPGVDRYGRTALHYAAVEGDVGKVQQLLRDGADPNARDDDGWSALHFAAQAKSGSCIRALLAVGAAVDLHDANGNSALSTAVFNSRGDGAIIRLLRQAGADPRAANHHGMSPLKLARTIANYDVAQFFSDVSEDEVG
jgi:ankyrin repeat protein